MRRGGFPPRRKPLWSQRLAAATVAAAIAASVSAAAAAENEHENDDPAAISAEAIITHNFFPLSTIHLIPNSEMGV